MSFIFPRTITEAVPQLRRGNITPVDLVEKCFQRIDLYDARIRAWAYTDYERALAEADRRTEELRRGLDRGPLHGIPVGIKDIIDVYDMPTGCGSSLWANSYAREDAFCVARLREAGAVILGKTTTTPFAFLDPPPTRNPWNLDRTPGGSSSGSAAAVAAGMCFAALGTQTGGSVTRPASFCGVYSIKPTYKWIPTAGVLPLARSLDHVGIMANSVTDLAILYEALASFSSISKCSFPYFTPDVIRHHSLPMIRRPRGLYDHITEPIMAEALETLLQRDLGGVSVEDWMPPGLFAEVLERHRAMMAVGAAETHADRFRRHPEDYPPKISELIEEGLRINAWDMTVTRRMRNHLRAQLDQVLTESILLTPASPGPPPDLSTTGNAACNSLWSFTGLPTVSIPFQWTSDGLPLAIQLVGRQHREMELLHHAALLDQMIGFSTRPLPL